MTQYTQVSSLRCVDEMLFKMSNFLTVIYIKWVKHKHYRQKFEPVLKFIYADIQNFSKFNV